MQQAAENKEALDRKDSPSFVGDYFCSFPERIRQIEANSPLDPRTRSNLERALALIDPAERQAFLENHRERLSLGWFKYADFPYWAHRNVVQAQGLGLDRSPPLDILDIGMGPGSFAMVARSMGHRVIGTDVPNRWYDDFCRLAGVERLNAPIRQNETYMPLDRRFDLISIMMPNFHRYEEAGKFTYWSVEHWRFLLADLAVNLLKTGGRIFILMPPDRGGEGRYVPSALVDWARQRGAKVRPNANGLSATEIIFDPAEPTLFQADSRG